MCEKLVGLGDVDLVGINDSGEGAPLGVVIGSRKPRCCVSHVAARCGRRVYRNGSFGGFTGVRSACAAAVAETALDVPEHRL